MLGSLHFVHDYKCKDLEEAGWPLATFTEQRYIYVGWKLMLLVLMYCWGGGQGDPHKAHDCSKWIILLWVLWNPQEWHCRVCQGAYPLACTPLCPWWSFDAGSLQICQRYLPENARYEQLRLNEVEYSVFSMSCVSAWFLRQLQCLCILRGLSYGRLGENSSKEAATYRSFINVDGLKSPLCVGSSWYSPWTSLSKEGRANVDRLFQIPWRRWKDEITGQVWH